MSIHCYSATTVSKHKKDCDAWISIHGNVYDVTNFITVVSVVINEKYYNYNKTIISNCKNMQ